MKTLIFLLITLFFVQSHANPFSWLLPDEWTADGQQRIRNEKVRVYNDILANSACIATLDKMTDFVRLLAEHPIVSDEPLPTTFDEAAYTFYRDTNVLKNGAFATLSDFETRIEASCGQEIPKERITHCASQVIFSSENYKIGNIEYTFGRLRDFGIERKETYRQNTGEHRRTIFLKSKYESEFNYVVDCYKDAIDARAALKAGL